MTITAPTPLWIATGPVPTLRQKPRRVLTDTGALVLLGELTSFAAVIGHLGDRRPRATAAHG